MIARTSDMDRFPFIRVPKRTSWQCDLYNQKYLRMSREVITALPVRQSVQQVMLASIVYGPTLLFPFNPLNAELNPICYLLALLGAHHFLHVSRIRVKSLTLRQLMSYIYIYIYICVCVCVCVCVYGAPILDVSRSHTTTHHSR